GHRLLIGSGHRAAIPVSHRCTPASTAQGKLGRSTTATGLDRRLDRPPGAEQEQPARISLSHRCSYPSSALAFGELANRKPIANAASSASRAVSASGLLAGSSVRRGSGDESIIRRTNSQHCVLLSRVFRCLEATWRAVRLLEFDPQRR